MRGLQAGRILREGGPEEGLADPQGALQGRDQPDEEARDQARHGEGWCRGLHGTIGLLNTFLVLKLF